MNGSAFEFTGFIESINIKGVGATGDQFLFSLISPKGDKHWSFLLDPSEPTRFSAMASLISVAYGTNKIVRLNTSVNAGGPSFASEIEVVRRSD